jgi:hypothetical protein
MRSGFEALGRLHLQAILLLIVVFLIGCLAGVAFERTFLRPGSPPRHGGPPPGGLPPEFSERLHLTRQQTQQIQAILDRNRPRTSAVLDQFLPRLRSVTDSVRAEVRAVLTPGQQKTFDREPPNLFGGHGGAPLEGGPPPGRPGERPPGGPPGGPPNEPPGEPRDGPPQPAPGR